MYCARNAELIDLDPVVSIDRILGSSVPDEVLDVYVDAIDPARGPEFFSVSSCPLYMVDPDSAQADAGILVDIMSESRVVTAGVSSAWSAQNPSDTLVEGVVLLRSEVEAAAHFKQKKNEGW
tara:strand:+ start:370 stop:735 length:366 start_codon:yes stop_codon:yes gene_type:complete